eukprot:TRINITY_DN20638_c0_g1_i1.p1 TRINITY_DN20638_c0_g1~~TRINITY_DN20638_c0_g1_i1.p1  ORF type:complete len:109 (+),score=10.73 TRINITY_DN20638_c0_g1_i1:91-417(+)
MASTDHESSPPARSGTDSLAFFRHLDVPAEKVPFDAFSFGAVAIGFAGLWLRISIMPWLSLFLALYSFANRTAGLMDTKNFALAIALSFGALIALHVAPMPPAAQKTA